MSPTTNTDLIVQLANAGPRSGVAAGLTARQRQLAAILANFGPDAVWLLKSEVAGLMGVSVRTIEAWRQKGRRPKSVKRNGRVLWSLREVSDFLDNGPTQSGGAA